MVLNLDNWVDVFPMCTPKILRIATKNWDPFFKGKNVTLDPRPINLWGPSFSRGSHLSYESMSHLLLGGACRPQYLNHRNEAKGCCTVADVFAYIFFIYSYVYIYIYHIQFFFFPIFHSLILYPCWSQQFLEMGSFFTILLRLGIFGESEGLLLLAPLAKQPLTAWSLRGWKEPLTAECMKPWIFNFGEQESST